jgi:hypothetical protein
VSVVEHRAERLACLDRIDLDKEGVVMPAEMKSVGGIK